MKNHIMASCVELLSAAEMTKEAIAKPHCLNLSTLLLIHTVRDRFLVNRFVITTSTKLLQTDYLA